MKVIVTRPNEDGSYDEVGMNNRFLTSNYKTIKGLIRYGIPKHFKGKIRLEVYRGSIYKDNPDAIHYTYKY